MENDTGYTLEELIFLTGCLSEKYTGKENTSVRYETARQLMGAVLYCIRMYQHQDTGLPAKVRVSAGEAYQTGYQCVVEKTRETQQKYNRLIMEFKDYGNEAYYDTVVRGMPEFFRRYDARFCPQDHMLTLDYPVLRRLEGLCGICRIAEYLRCIELEQRFLAKLPEKSVREILLEYHPEYEGLFINLAEIVTDWFMGKMLTHSGMDVDKTDVLEVERRLQEGLQKLIEERFGNDQEILEYLGLTVHDFVVLQKNRRKDF